MAGLDETHSSNNSTYGLDNVQLNRCSVHPEQWTLPQEWNIEMREVYANWKLDVQSQIKHLDNQLHSSLKQYPCNGDQGQYNPGYCPVEQTSEAAMRSTNTGKMQIGLRRT